ncbi:plasmid pRiA4b ORF-3 family protein [Phormidium tenue FACHB-886]|nr:plasmid pRiA4b ORF-3 family protein [Phormidium tenue FACHB-886]
MKSVKVESAPEIYQLKITLLEIKPVIWRRLLVSEQTTLSGLHRIIQAAFDWWNYHLHLFEIAGVRYSQPEFEIAEEWDEDIKNEKRFRLGWFDFGKGDKFYYEYDFGDSWRHEILFERMLSSERTVRYPKCVDGARSRPPEDVGGASGYKYFLEAIKKPAHPAHEEYLEWAGGAFDAEYFSLDETNERIRKAVRQS